LVCGLAECLPDVGPSEVSSKDKLHNGTKVGGLNVESPATSFRGFSAEGTSQTIQVFPGFPLDFPQKSNFSGQIS
jgi:hypothetical protein